MSFLDQREAFDSELDSFYATYPVDVDDLCRSLSQQSRSHPEWTPFRRKALCYEAAARECDVKVFRHCPFYFELQSGRSRHSWGRDGIGGWLRSEPFGLEYERRAAEWREPWQGLVSFNGQADSDLDHHCVGYDNVLRLGLRGLIDRAQQRLETAEDHRQREFLQAQITGLEAMIAIAHRFGERAHEMLADEADPRVRSRLERIAQTAPRVPAEPPATFFEALNTILFSREIIASIDGMGVSAFGHIDRMLWPYYQADLAAGRITPEEAKDLLAAFLAYTDVKFEALRMRKETSTVVFIGGCNADGEVVYNDVTRMIVECYRELRLVSPKLQARLSPRHSQEYFALLADFIAAGTNVMAVYNDDVVIEANVKTGKALRDARLYVGGGCQENILQNTEISSRATMFFSLPAVLEIGLRPGTWAAFREGERLELTSQADCANFEGFYHSYLENLRRVVHRLIENRNRLEAQGAEYNACPLLSATIDDCTADAKDMTEGGCRYSTASVDFVGIGTLIDSLYAVRRMVFETGEMTMDELAAACERDFEGLERLRQRLIHRAPKFGRDDDAVLQAFAARVFADLAAIGTGQPNSRGGQYVASLFAHRSNVSRGRACGATPDGRNAKDDFSQGMGPSITALGPRGAIGDVLSAIEPVDLTAYPVVAVLDMKLPLTPGGRGAMLVEAVLHRFLACGGSVLQVNAVDARILREARENPQRHPDLTVRVSGFSARFSTLDGATQDEVIRRAELHAGT